RIPAVRPGHDPRGLVAARLVDEGVDDDGLVDRDVALEAHLAQGDGLVAAVADDDAVGDDRPTTSPRVAHGVIIAGAGLRSRRTAPPARRSPAPSNGRRRTSATTRSGSSRTRRR